MGDPAMNAAEALETARVAGVELVKGHDLFVLVSRASGQKGKDGRHRNAEFGSVTWPG
jgi:hypothetical protein